MPQQKSKTRSSPRKAAKLSRSGSPDSRNGPPVWGAAAVLVIAIGAVYGRNLHAPFIFDDAVAIVGNGSITSLWPLIGSDEHPGPLNSPPDLPTSARPIVNLSFAMNYCVGGLH